MEKIIAYVIFLLNPEFNLNKYLARKKKIKREKENRCG
jgi:hypothetical protein